MTGNRVTAGGCLVLMLALVGCKGDGASTMQSGGSQGMAGQIGTLNGGGGGRNGGTPGTTGTGGTGGTGGTVGTGGTIVDGGAGGFPIDAGGLPMDAGMADAAPVDITGWQAILTSRLIEVGTLKGMCATPIKSNAFTMAGAAIVARIIADGGKASSVSHEVLWNAGVQSAYQWMAAPVTTIDAALKVVDDINASRFEGCSVSVGVAVARGQGGRIVVAILTASCMDCGDACRETCL